MARRTLKILVFALGIATLVPCGQVSALPLGGPASGQHGFLASLWGSLASLWSAAGCELDPSGRCVSSRAGTAPAYAGRGTGRLVNVRGAAGCEIDPSGRSVKSPLGGPTCGAVVTSGSVASTVR